MMMSRPCPSGSRLLKTFSKLKKNVYNEKMTRGHFSIMNYFCDLKKVFSNLNTEGQRGAIIMKVTRLLLLGLFYTIQMQIYVLFCTRLYRISANSFLGNYSFWNLALCKDHSPIYFLFSIVY